MEEYYTLVFDDQTDNFGNQKEFSVLHYNVGFQQSVDNTGVPSSQNEECTIEIEVHNTTNISIAEWINEHLSRERMLKNGKLLIYNYSDDSMLRTIRFENSECIELFEGGIHLTGKRNMEKTLRFTFVTKELIVDEQPLSGKSKKEKKPTPTVQENIPDALVTAVTGPKTLEVGKQVKFTAIDFNEHTQEADFKRIKWAVQIDDEVQRLKPQGKVLRYTPDKSLEGKDIVVMPYLKQYTPRVSVKATILCDTKNDVDNEEPKKFCFDKDKSYPITIAATTYVGLSAGPLGASYDYLEVSYMGETIESSGISTGAGLGTEILTRLDSNEVTFHTDIQGESMLEVFNQTGLTTVQKAGGMVSGGIIKGFDSPETMNLIWSAKLFGAGLKAGVSSDRSTAPFKNKE